MNDDQRFVLERNLSRFDSYINAINAKAAFIVSFNTFVLGTLLLKQDVFLAPYSFHSLSALGAIIFIACILSIALAIVAAFLATTPFLKEGKGKGRESTLLFFGSVAQMGREAYTMRLKRLSKEEVLRDLTDQTQELACGASAKFEKIHAATMVTVFGTIFTLFLTALLRFIDWVFN